MAREIKFRAWHEKKKTMFPAEQMAADQMTLLPTGVFINISPLGPAYSEIYSQMLPLQFTGLHDKNGKEVYEGDLLKDIFGPFLVKHGHFSFEYGASDGEEDYNASMDSYGWYGENPVGECRKLSEYSEVIGNIHENADLFTR